MNYYIQSTEFKPPKIVPVKIEYSIFTGTILAQSSHKNNRGNPYKIRFWHQTNEYYTTICAGRTYKWEVVVGYPLYH